MHSPQIITFLEDDSSNKTKSQSRQANAEHTPDHLTCPTIRRS